ncbi:rab-like protein 6 isoform X2 [Malaclemys terrapin pileata]|uniref:rab-like protein 6 isoform X2 n=1 Tax=Malaclemys terrapin pileata TaxID=2991368 RepID=UPI0023A7E798|nr:rab-like protein 6 isoform X2 [Malaclemys terrapin pileata]
MFSALKKLVGSDQAPVRDKNIPAGLQSMNQALQRRFAKGVQYNTTDDIVKVEVWDVVDKGKCKKRGDGLKLENDPQEAESEMALDAEFLDVYKNCNGVVMMFDITKQWTFNYILRELPKVPTHVPVCVLGNYRDMGEHRVILPDDMRAFIDNLNRPPGSSYFRYAESSMKNSFGLKYLHKFFNIPFLQLQRETLLRQLETNQLDIDATLEELSVQQETEDQNYEIFLEMMESRSRGHASPMATNGQSPSSGSQSPIVPPSCTSDSSSPGTPQPPPPPQQPPANATSPEPPSSLSPVPPLEAQLPHTSSPATASPTMPVVVPLQKRSIISRLFGTSPAPETSPPAPDAATIPPSEVPAKVQSVEDFIPDDSLDHSFLEDTISQRDKGITRTKDHNESDSDGEALGGNPMVAGFQDDLDLDDKVPSKPSLAAELVPSKNITLSSEEEAEMEDAVVTIMADEDIDMDYETQWSSKNSMKPQKEAASTKAPDQKPQGSLPPHSGFEKHGSTKLPTDLPATGAAAPTDTASVQAQRTTSQNKGSASKLKGSKEEMPEESDSDQEGPIATQMLSFVMDDPDFESEESDSQRKKVGEFPVREDPSDISDEDTSLAKPPQPMKPTVHSFKLKNDSDLFGLGLEETGPKESSDEDKEKHPSKEKKKKKKKSKEEEEKSMKKKSKHKKCKEKEESKDEKKKKKKRSKEKNDEIDELEAFLGGGASASKQQGGGDYEEL